jgi:hypothetical protein
VACSRHAIVVLDEYQDELQAAGFEEGIGIVVVIAIVPTVGRPAGKTGFAKVGVEILRPGGAPS